ncbi:MAG: hypothetical protein JOY57_06200 [Actinobacteria bacterium]|nr:hypothetical protein [Actinomycetota bacterium]
MPEDVIDPIEPLPDHAIAIRGGVIGSLDDLLDQAELAMHEDGYYALSVFCGHQAPGETVGEVILRIANDAPIPNGKLRVAIVRELRKRGFELEQVGLPACHYDVKLGTVLDREVVGRFAHAFWPPRRNPRWP